MGSAYSLAGIHEIARATAYQIGCSTPFPRAFSLVRSVRNREGLLPTVLSDLLVEYQRPTLLCQEQRGSPRLATPERSVQVFLSFARFPWKQESYDRGRRVVEFQDLAFVDHPMGGPLSLRIRMYESGAIESMEFGHRF